MPICSLQMTTLFIPYCITACVTCLWRVQVFRFISTVGDISVPIARFILDVLYTKPGTYYRSVVM